MLDAPLRRLIDPALRRVSGRLAAAGIAANELTVGGFVVGLLAMVLIARGAMVAGLLCLLLNRIADGLDGPVAHHRNATDLGGYLDIVLDFLIYAGVVFAFAAHDPAGNALAAAFLLFAFMGTGSSFLAFAIMAAKRRIETAARGRKSIYYLGGLTEGTETMLFMVAICLFPGAFATLAWSFAALCWLTTAGRILTAWQVLR